MKQRCPPYWKPAGIFNGHLSLLVTSHPRYYGSAISTYAGKLWRGCNVGVFPNISSWMFLYECSRMKCTRRWGRTFREEDGTSRCSLSIRAKFVINGAILAIYRRIIKQFFERFDRIRINSRRMRDYKLEDVTKVEGDSSSSISRAWPISRR